MTRDPESVYRATPDKRLPLFEQVACNVAASRGAELDQGSAPQPIAHARRSDPHTSHEAAKSVRNISETQSNILELFRDWGPMTDEQLIGRYRDRVIIGQFKNSSPEGIRSRRAELTRAPHYMVADSGQTEAISTGRQATIWRLA